ncbi:MAG: hypothetical protein ACK4UY_15800 [Dietzia sp.]
MSMAAVAQASRWAAAVVLLCSLSACSAESEESSAGPTPGSAQQGSPGQGKGSSKDLDRLQGDAESAAGQIASGDGLRVENKTGGPVVLIFPDGDTAEVAAGKLVTILRPCPERLPLQAESTTGDLIAERGGPCRERDTWTLE